MTLATLTVIDTITPSQVELVSTLDDGRVVVRFPGGSEWTVPGHTVSVVHRVGGAATSRAAGAAQSGAHLSETQFKVLAALAAAGPFGLTDHEHYDRNGVTQSTAGKRRLELQRQGLVRDTGDTRPTPLGADATVWQITNAGEDALAKARTTHRIGHVS